MSWLWYIYFVLGILHFLTVWNLDQMDYKAINTNILGEYKGRSLLSHLGSIFICLLFSVLWPVYWTLLLILFFVSSVICGEQIF